MFLKCFVDPEDIIKKEAGMVGRRQPPQAEVRLVHHQLSEFPNF
jgi:hypothetical protein